jgi:hypothetical protein
MAKGGSDARKARDFYTRALGEAEKNLLPQARELEGLDEEIALLRVKLIQVLREKPQDLELLLKGVGMLVRAVSTRYRLSKKGEEDLYQSVLGVLRGIGDALSPEEGHGV